MSASLFNRAKEIIPGGVNSPVRFYEPYPFFASYGKGSKIITEEHDTLIDYCLGAFVAIFFLASPAIAVRRAATKTRRHKEEYQDNQ